MSFRHNITILFPKWKIHVLSRMSGVPSSAKARYLHPSGSGSGILIYPEGEEEELQGFSRKFQKVQLDSGWSGWSGVVLVVSGCPNCTWAGGINFKRQVHISFLISFFTFVFGLVLDWQQKYQWQFLVIVGVEEVGLGR